MIDVIRSRISADTEIVNGLQAILGVSMTSAGAANLIGWINIASSFLSLLIALIGLVLTVFTIINARHKVKQNEVKTKMDLLMYEKAKREHDAANVSPLTRI
mgnify:CR=1 FL=1